MRSSWRLRPLELGQASELIVVGLVELVERGQVGLVEVLVGLSQLLWAWLEGWAGLGPDETVLELMEPFKKTFHSYLWHLQVSCHTSSAGADARSHAVDVDLASPVGGELGLTRAEVQGGTGARTHP